MLFRCSLNTQIAFWVIQLILTGGFFIAVSNFLSAGPFGNVINQSNLAQCIPFQKNTTVVLTNDQVNSLMFCFTKAMHFCLWDLSSNIWYLLSLFVAVCYCIELLVIACFTGKMVAIFRWPSVLILKKILINNLEYWSLLGVHDTLWSSLTLVMVYSHMYQCSAFLISDSTCYAC